MSAPSVEQPLTDLVELADLGTDIRGQLAVLHLALTSDFDLTLTGADEGVVRFLMRVESDLARLNQGLGGLVERERAEPRLTGADRDLYETIIKQVRCVLAYAPDCVPSLKRVIAACAQDLPLDGPAAGAPASGGS